MRGGGGGGHIPAEKMRPLQGPWKPSSPESTLAHPGPLPGHPDAPPPLPPAFFAGIVLAALLTLGAVLSAAATVRGAGGLMAAVSAPSWGPRSPPRPCVPKESEAQRVWDGQDPPTWESGPLNQQS